MANLKVQLEGAEELEKALKRLPPRLRKKQLRTAIRRSVALIRDDIKQTAPIRDRGTASKARPKPGRLRRLIRIRPRRPKRGYLKVSLFYPVLRELGTRDDPKNAFYWRFVVNGTKHTPANDYIQRSVDKNFRRVLSKVITETNAGIRSELAKLKAAA